MTEKEIEKLHKLLDKATTTLAKYVGGNLQEKLAIIRLAKRIEDGQLALRLAFFELKTNE